MADSRTKNATRNIASGIVNQLATILLMFAARTAILYLLGVNYLGVGTLFSSVLSFLNLAELGMASAVVFAMYKPVAEEDYETLNALVAYYKKIYWTIGFVILTMGTVIVPAIPRLIKGEPPAEINVYVLYYIYLVNSVVSYFFQGYKQSILFAFQREDITKNVTTVVKIVFLSIQIVALFLTKSFYVYAFIPIVCTLAINAVNAYEVRKHFPRIRPGGKVGEEIKASIRSRLSGLLGTKMYRVVVHQTDILVVSAFLGLDMTGIYGNYYYIFNAINGIVIMLFTPLTASIGNKLILDSVEESHVLFKRLEYGNAWIVCFCSVCFFCLFEPFVAIWTGEANCLGQRFAAMMVGYFFIYQIQRTVLIFKDAAGIWREDKLRPYTSMVINVVCNLVFVRYFGIYGVVAATILVFMISMPWANMVLFRTLFRMNPVFNLLLIAKYAVITASACILSYGACSFCPSGPLGIILRLLICCIVSTAVFFLPTSRSPEFLFWVSFLKDNTKKLTGA